MEDRDLPERLVTNGLPPKVTLYLDVRGEHASDANLGRRIEFRGHQPLRPPKAEMSVMSPQAILVSISAADSWTATT